MNIGSSITISVLMVIGLGGSVLAAPSDFFTRSISPEKDRLIFTSSKGEVIFSHSKHARSLKEHECILCHRIGNPNLKNIQSRFEDHRVAHYFCKGCHSDMAKGPTECHQCHNYKKIT